MRWADIDAEPVVEDDSYVTYGEEGGFGLPAGEPTIVPGDDPVAMITAMDEKDRPAERLSRSPSPVRRTKAAKKPSAAAAAAAAAAVDEEAALFAAAETYAAEDLPTLRKMGKSDPRSARIAVIVEARLVREKAAEKTAAAETAKKKTASKRRAAEDDGGPRKKTKAPRPSSPTPSPAPAPKPRPAHGDESTLRMSSGDDDDEFDFSDGPAPTAATTTTTKRNVAFPLAKVGAPSPGSIGLTGSKERRIGSTGSKQRRSERSKPESARPVSPVAPTTLPGASLVPVKVTGGRDKEDIDAVCAAMHALKRNRAREVELKIARVVKDLQAETRAQAQALADEIAAARKGHEDAARARAEKSAARYEAIVADADAALARIKAETKRRIRAFEEVREEDDRARAELAAAVARSEEEMGRKAGAVKDSVARKSARAAAKVSELQKERDSGLGLRDMLMTLVQQLGPSE